MSIRKLLLKGKDLSWKQELAILLISFFPVLQLEKETKNILIIKII